MSIGSVVKAGRGKQFKGHLYIELKNGAVYKHPTYLTQEAQHKLLSKVAENGRRVHLNNWDRVRAAS
jgi:hypothetical protein